MAKETQVVAWEHGELRTLLSRPSGREAVLALPLTRLLVKMVHVPAGEDPVAVATPVLKAISPFPDDDLTVSCEIVGESEKEKIVMAAALPESATDDIGEALDGMKLAITRVDATILGQIRMSWDRISASGDGRRLLRIKSPDCTSLVVIDGDRPVAIRAVTDGADMKREETLSLLEAEDFGGAKPLDATVDIDMDDSGEALRGIAERSDDPSAMNALPESWREMLFETRFKAKLAKFLSVAGAIWALAMGVLLGVPLVYDFMTDRQKGLSRQHARKYKEVVAMKERVGIVRKYSDHTLGALEIMKAVSDRLPDGVTLNSWNYRRGDSLRIGGDAPLQGEELEFKELMEALTYTDESGEERNVFTSVRLGGTSESKGVRRFNIDLNLKPEEE